MAKERSAMALTRACARSSLTRARLACRARRALILRSTRVRVFPSTPDLEEGTKQGVVRVRRCQSGNSQGKNIRRSWYLGNVIFVIGFEFRRDCYHDMKTQPLARFEGNQSVVVHPCAKVMALFFKCENFQTLTFSNFLKIWVFQIKVLESINVEFHWNRL